MTEADDIIAHVGIYGAAVVIGLVSSVLPIISAEVFVAGVVIALTRDPLQVVALGCLVAIGQVAAKVPMYYGSRGVSQLVRPTPGGRIARMLRWIETRAIDRWREHPAALTFVSATLGIPPFYAIALVAGAIEIPFPGFLAVGLVGRIIRFVTIGVVALYAAT
jgi:membrane protein YqaA with SNARE-associated domain